MDYNKELDNNQAVILGQVERKPVYSHEVMGEDFYMMYILVKRLSGVDDCVPVMLSERLFDLSEDLVGREVLISGQFRSYNKIEGGKKRLKLAVFARKMEFPSPNLSESNDILLDGYLCREPVYRITPSGREIADILLAVNRPYGKSDYIPCVCWGRNAKYVTRMDVGDHMQVLGRIQSREYTKKLPGDNVEKRTAYEVSVGRLECMIDS